VSTLDEMVEMVRDIVYGSRSDLRPLKDTLHTNVDDSALEFRMVTEAMWNAGNWVQWEPDGEIVEFSEDHVASGTTTVFKRGERNTTALLHTAGDIALFEPKLPRHQIEQKISDVINNDLWPIIWIRNERTVTGYDSAQDAYELAVGDVSIEQMYQYDINNDLRYHEFPTAWYYVKNAVASGIPSGATSGKILVIKRVVNADATIYYSVKSKPLSTAPTALPTELVEMVVVASAGKLLMQTPSERRQRGSGRTRTGEQASDYGAFMAEFLRLRGQYVNRLRLELMQAKRHVQAPRAGKF